MGGRKGGFLRKAQRRFNSVERELETPEHRPKAGIGRRKCTREESSVKFPYDMPENRTVPDSTPAPADPYCGNCGYVLKGLSDSARCPECGKPIVEVLMRPGFLPRGRRYRSKATLFGWPVVDIALGPYGAERRGRARGVIAIGDLAFGGLAIGGYARGIVAFGGLAAGVFSVGGLAVGLLSAVGGFAISGGLSAGGMTFGTLSLGGLAVGFIAQGGLAVGKFARGGQSIGRRFPRSFRSFQWFFGHFPPTPLEAYQPMLFALAPALIVAGMICLVALAQIARCREGE
jgi:hypothetical protein